MSARPFIHIGNDYAGPFNIKWHKGQKSIMNKAHLSHICLYEELATFYTQIEAQLISRPPLYQSRIIIIEIVSCI